MQVGGMFSAESRDIIVAGLKKDNDIGFLGRIELANGPDEPFKAFKEAVISAGRKACFVPERFHGKFDKWCGARGV
jgi:hypothetical protein